MLEHRTIRDAEEKAQAEMLLARCDVAEGLELPVVIPDPGDPPDGGCPAFLWYEGKVLAGLLILEGWPIPEGTPLVHPEYRRRGIARALVQAATANCRERSGRRWLMAADSESIIAPSFAEKLGARYENSEYRMDLDRNVLPPRPPAEDNSLRMVGLNDLDLFAAILAKAFDDPVEQVRTWSADQFGHPNVKLLIGYVDGQPAGTLRLITVGFHAYLTAVGVLPAFRRRGIGRWIVLSAADDLIEEGWQNIRIEVDTANESAYRLYRSCGFRETRTYRFYEILT